MNRITGLIIRLITVVFSMACLAQADWLSLGNHQSGQIPEIDIINSNEQFVTIDVKISGFDIERVNTENMENTNHEIFTRLAIPDCFRAGEIGNPELPVIKKTIGVPHNATLNVEIISSTYQDINLQTIGINERIMPARASVVKLPGHKPVLTIDELSYAKDEFFPQTIARISNDDLIRGYRLASIEIAPIQYNPAAHKIRCYIDLRIRIDFLNGDMAKTEQPIRQHYSPRYNDFMKKRVLNYDLFAPTLRNVLPLPISYLIVTHNTFQNQIQPLVQWYKKIGFDVKIANQDSIATWTNAGIRTFIHNQAPWPTFVLLVGDENGYMPAFSGSAISGEVTDLYYAEMDYSGYLPDLGVARLPCANVGECTTMVNKILNYRRAIFATNSWLTNDAFCAGTDNYTVSEGTHNYCTTNFMDPNGYTTHKLYMVTYGATTTDVTNTINSGVGLITMSGHGAETGWYDGPQFTNSNVYALTNGDMLPIATGHACYTNEFHTNPCFGETWLKKSGGGGIAYYGASCYSYWDEDDWLQRAWYEAIYADSIYEHSRFTQDGMYDGVYMSGSPIKQYYYEAYNIMGDPALEPWTAIPDSILVTHNTTVFTGPSNFTIVVTENDGVTPIVNGLVGCWIPNQTPEMHVAAYTDSLGQATLNISPNTADDTMSITVTKHNRIPYEGYAIVTSAGISNDLIATDLPSTTILRLLSPNPFNKNMNIEYQIAKSCAVNLMVYDMSGRLVRNLKSGSCTPGYYTASWDGDDNRNRLVPNGVYFIKFSGGTYNRIAKAILLR